MSDLFNKVQGIGAPRESDGQWRRKPSAADRSNSSAYVLLYDIMLFGFLWLSYPFLLSSCFTFGHGGCSFQCDVLINHVNPIACMSHLCSLTIMTALGSYHHDCTWLKEKARCVQGSIVTLPGCLTCSIPVNHPPPRKRHKAKQQASFGHV